MTQEVKYSFSNLGMWRKIFLVLNILGSGMFISIYVWAHLKGDASIGLFIFCVVFSLESVWLYHAVSQRKLKQLKVLAFLSIIPMGNLVLLLIMLAIISTTKKEISA